MARIISELAEFSFFAKSFILQVYDVLARHGSRDEITGTAQLVRQYHPSGPCCVRGERLGAKPVKLEPFYAASPYLADFEVGRSFH